MMEALKCQLEGNSGRKFNRVDRISGYLWLQQESSTGLPESESISDFSQKVQQGCQRQWVFLTLARKFNSVVDSITICLTESFYFQ